MSFNLVSKLALAHGVIVPTGYQNIVDLGMTDLYMWKLVSDENADEYYRGINFRYPHRCVIPFAEREDTEDVACIVVQDLEQDPGQVIVIHDYTSSGYEVDGRYKCFWEWFRVAINDMIDGFRSLP